MDDDRRDPNDPGGDAILPPNNIEAEQGLIGALLLNNRAYDNVASILQPEFFFDPLHAELYAAIARRIERGEVADPVVLQRDVSAEVTPGYMVGLTESTPSVINAPHYAEVIRRCALAREALHQGQELIRAARAVGPGSGDVQDAASEALAAIEAIAAGTARPAVHIYDAASEAISAAEDAVRTKGRSSGLPTGLAAFDSQTGGLPLGEVTIFAGRTGMGKTALAGSVALGAAKADVPVLLFSLEMAREHISNRLLSIESGISGDAARRGRLDEAAMQMFSAAQEVIGDLPILIDDDSGLTVEQICARTRALARRGKARLVIIDYLGLVRASDPRERSRVYQIEHVTTTLKRLAKSLNIAVVVLVQINRAVENREDKRPGLADLRDSGSIEQDAGMVVMIYREEYYKAQSAPDPSDSKWAEHQADLLAIQGFAELIIAKMRHGRSNYPVRVRWEAATTEFRDA